MSDRAGQQECDAEARPLWERVHAEERTLAYVSACSLLECHAVAREDEAIDLRTLDLGEDALREAFQYLEMRGLIEQDPDDPELVYLRDESEGDDPVAEALRAKDERIADLERLESSWLTIFADLRSRIETKEFTFVTVAGTRVTIDLETAQRQYARHLLQIFALKTELRLATEVQR